MSIITFKPVKVLVFDNLRIMHSAFSEEIFPIADQSRGYASQGVANGENDERSYYYG